ncbi:hypothetical protein GWD52_14710 [Enterobacteriaceae bacterium 4M9]|nr:hypothetical protein [Enterobacteriaceae bacterium 4M9]
MQISDINDLFTSITRVSGNGLRIALHPDVIDNPSMYGYKIGFAISDSQDNAWPAPFRNLNNTGKLLVPNYGFPKLPETIGEFVQRIELEGDVETNSITFNIPGVDDSASIGTMHVCVIDTEDYELKEPTFMAYVFID